MGHFSVEVAGPDPLRLIIDVAEASEEFEVVGTAPDDDATIDMAARAQPDVIVLDEVLVDDVSHVIHEVATRSPRTRVLVLHADGEEVQPAVVADADGLLGRAMQPTRLVAEISALMTEATRTVASQLPQDPRSAGAARQLVRRAAAAWGAGGLEDTLALLATELVANAVRHGDSDVEIVIRLTDDRVRVEVRDSSPAEPTLQTMGAQRETGRGVAIVDALAAAWGVEPTGEGKNVWFELGRD